LFIKYFPKLSPRDLEEVLRGVPPKVRVAAMTPQEKEEFLQTIPPEERLEGLPPEARLAGLSEAQIRQYLEKLTASRKTSKRKPRRKKK
jgi:hypothetical protein